MKYLNEIRMIMKAKGIILKPGLMLLLVLTAKALYPQTVIEGGNVSGTWTIAGSPYLIEGEISVAGGQTLMIEPGVLVEFQDHYKLNVQGRLLATGTLNDSIIFTIDDTTGFTNLTSTDGGWHGIRFGYSATGADTSRISFCRLEWGKALGNAPDNYGGAISVESYNQLIISNSLVTHNYAASAGGGIAVSNSGIIIRNNTIAENGAGFAGGGLVVSACDPLVSDNRIADNLAFSSGGGIGLSSGADPELKNNIIVSNNARYGGGIQMQTSCNPMVLNNLIYLNNAESEGGGIDMEGNCHPTFVNNTIVYNSAPMGGGIDCEINTSPVFRNTLLWWNVAWADGAQVHLFSEDSDPDFYYCDIEGGSDAFGLWYGGSTYFTYTGVYENNMDENPDTTAAGGYLFLLSDNSPCVDSGDPGAEFNDPEDPSNPGFALWPARGGLRNDIGVYGGPGCLLTPTITGIEAELFPGLMGGGHLRLRLYPNPVASSAVIAWSQPAWGSVVLEVVDLTGRVVRTIEDGELAKGDHQVSFCPDGLVPGVYCCRLSACGKVEARKLVICKQR